jgi:hypothetical protein
MENFEKHSLRFEHMKAFWIRSSNLLVNNTQDSIHSGKLCPEDKISPSQKKQAPISVWERIQPLSLAK